jgi:hypothetical protein
METETAVLGGRTVGGSGVGNAVAVGVDVGAGKIATGTIS